MAMIQKKLNEHERDVDAIIGAIMRAFEAVIRESSGKIEEEMQDAFIKTIFMALLHAARFDLP